MNMRRFRIGFLLLATALPSVAMASGNADCVIEEPGLEFTFEALFSTGTPAALLQPRASLEFHDPKYSSRTWKLELDGSGLRQQWRLGNEFKIMVETQFDGQDVTLEIQTTRVSEESSDFEGRYKLAIGPGAFLREGRATCSVG
jgi:hypothetical protein